MREERREEREERREKSAERSEKREEITKKAARDPQMRLFEQQQLTDKVCCAPVRVVTEGREQRKERREKREERKSPQARFTSFLQGPVATSKKF